jgi:hypothetical protein
LPVASQDKEEVLVFLRVPRPSTIAPRAQDLKKLVAATAIQLVAFRKIQLKNPSVAAHK